MEGIFESTFKLSYKKEDIEEEYKKIKLEKTHKYAFIISLCLFFASALTSIEISFFFVHYAKNEFKAIMVMSYFVTLCYLIMAFIGIFTNKYCLLKSINYVNYFFIAFIFMNFLFPLMKFVKGYYLFSCIMIYADIIIRMTWNIMRIYGFLESFILSSLQIVAIWIILVPLAESNDLYDVIYVILSYTLALILMVTFSYFLEKQQKTAYFYYHNANTKAIWLKNVLDHMNTGFLSINNENVSYINDYLAEILEHSKLLLSKEKLTQANYNQNIPEEENINVKTKEEDIAYRSNINANILLSSLLFNLNTENIIDKSVLKIINDFKIELQPILTAEESCLNITVNQNYVHTFAERVSQVASIHNFIFIGEQTIINEEENLEYNFEVYCRYNTSIKEGANLDLLLNDITRSKIAENFKSEIKYKSMFLSKVAHEFKNPLICITELINQVTSSPELRGCLTSTEVDKTLKQIKSMSNFLLILVKDLDFFSKRQIEDTITIEKNETNLNELIDFCANITQSLLNKSNKDDQIDFNVHKNVEVPKFIMTDEWRLKQILINLLSNAIKFTHHGQIDFEISKEVHSDPMIKFVIKDTGVGLKPDIQEKIFQPFNKGISFSNEFGSSLGLFIVSELVKKLGGSIEFKTESQKGSAFWFSLPYQEEEENLLKNIKELSDEDQEIVLMKKKKRIKNINSNHNDSVKTKTIDVALNKCEELLNECLNLNETVDKISRPNSDVVNTNKIQPADFPKVKSKSKLLGGSHSKDSLSSKNEPENASKEKENVAVQQHDKVKEQQIFSVEDFVLKNIYPLKIQYENKKLANVILADDERITRQSAIRILKEVEKELPVKINIIEADDGIELLYVLYKSIINGIKISAILSDETMNYLTGSKCCNIIHEICQDKNLNDTPFFIITAYENLSKMESVQKVLTKPLTKPQLMDLLKEYVLQNN